MTPALTSLTAELGITVVHPSKHRPHVPMHTAAGETLQRLLDEEGEGHLRDVLTALTESENNRHMLIAPVIKAVSKIMRENPTWFEDNASKFLEVLDRADIASMHEAAKANRAIVKSREAGIATMLLAEFRKDFQPVEQERLI